MSCIDVTNLQIRQSVIRVFRAFTLSPTFLTYPVFVGRFWIGDLLKRNADILIGLYKCRFGDLADVNFLFTKDNMNSISSFKFKKRPTAIPR
jgi:hypothetical protein